MTDLFQIAYLPFVTAFASTALITYLLIGVIKKMGLIDDPKIHKHPGIIHSKPIPRGGGIPLFLGALVSAILFIPMTKTTIAIFFAAFLALAIGVIDDKLNAKSRDVSPYLRFLVNILTAVIVVGSGISINYITNPFGGILHLDAITFPMFFFTLHLSDIVSVLWLIWIMNMVNWSKGVDGQMPGIVAISAIVIGILSLRLTGDSGDLLDAKLSFIIAGCAAGFLLLNFYPAKIFPGYGATSLYLLLGVASILSGAKLATAILVMGVPTMDALFTIGRRIFNRRSPFLHDNRHLHHILLKLGYNQRQIALFYWSISALLGIIALSLESKSKLFAIVMLIAIMGGALIFLHTVTKEGHEELDS